MLKIESPEDYRRAYARSLKDPDAFWAEEAAAFEWFRPWRAVSAPDMETAHNKWFVDGKLNITVNALDRHARDHGDRIALLWEPNDPDKPIRSFTYSQLLDEVCRAANALVACGVHRGDRVCLYMPMVPELVIAVLACARIGAIHSVVFAGFSAHALADRLRDAGCSLVITADFNDRGPKHIPVKAVVDEAINLEGRYVRHVLVFRNTGGHVPIEADRDLWWHELVPHQPTSCPPAIMDSEDPLFILYTSGSTGKPKGVVHSIGGYMVYTAFTFRHAFQYREGDVFCCTADVGWITGHSYIVYGPLLCGATVLMFEGVPTWPDPSRFWRMCDKHKVSIFYTAPTAIRALMAAGNAFAEGHDLSSIRVLGSVGEPINEDAWHWYHQRIGRGAVPVVDTWWQTETGGIMISPLAGITDNKPCYASYPMPGVEPVLVDKAGNILDGNDVEGLLCIARPWPSIIRTTYNDHGRCYQSYFSTFPGLYFTGDGARRDSEGRYRIIGRVDDVVNVSGHRIGTAEVENVINDHPAVVESAVVGFPHPIKGQGIFAYVIAHREVSDADGFFHEINALLTDGIGPIAKADRLLVVSGLPKTRSGKIMRRILRKVAEGDIAHLGDTSTLLNPEVVDEIIAKSKPL
jgi:acetyl-CoA synthetase